MKQSGHKRLRREGKKKGAEVRGEKERKKDAREKGRSKWLR